MCKKRWKCTVESAVRGHQVHNNSLYWKRHSLQTLCKCTSRLNSAEQMSPTSCKVSFLPWENNTYSVNVNFNRQPLKGSPFSVSIDNLLQPERAGQKPPWLANQWFFLVVDPTRSCCGASAISIVSLNNDTIYYIDCIIAQTPFLRKTNNVCDELSRENSINCLRHKM